MKFGLKSLGLLAVALVGLCLFVGEASAQCCHANAIAAPIYSAPLVSYAAPVVQLQQVVQAAPIVQQQVVQQQVQQVTVPTVPVLNFVQYQPLVQQVVSGYHSQAIVGGYGNRSAIVAVAPFNRVRQAIVVRSPPRAAIVVAPRVGRPLIQIGGRR